MALCRPGLSLPKLDQSSAADLIPQQLAAGINKRVGRAVCCCYDVEHQCTSVRIWRLHREPLGLGRGADGRFTIARLWRAPAHEPLRHTKAVGPPPAGAVHVPAAAVLPRCHTGQGAGGSAGGG